MASVSKHGGPSYTKAELADPDFTPVPARIRRPELGRVDREVYVVEDPEVEEESSSTTDGGDSIPSSENQPVSKPNSKASPRKPAQTTASRSKAQGKATDSAARSTAGNGPKTETESDKDDIDFDDFDDDA